MRALVLNVSKYDFVTPDGEPLMGIKVTFCEEPEYGKDKKGMMAMTVTGPYEAYKVFEHVPAFYDIELSHKPNSKGKVEAQYKDAIYREPIQLPQFTKVSKPA